MKNETRRQRPARMFPGLTWWLRYLKIECRRVWHSRPGQRFYSRYRRVRRRKDYAETGPRMIRILFAFTSLVAGVVCFFLPVPEVPFFILSGALFASESSALARTLDRLELRVRIWAQAVRLKWRTAPMPVKGLWAGLVLGLVAGQCYLLCRACLN